MTVREALAALLLAYSQKVKDWNTYEVELVANCKAALENADAVDRQKFSEAQQEAERQEREEGREGGERYPQEDWQRGSSYQGR
jgi:hypothetical protein